MYEPDDEVQETEVLNQLAYDEGADITDGATDEEK